MKIQSEYYKDWMTDIRGDAIPSVNIEILTGLTEQTPLIIVNGKMMKVGEPITLDIVAEDIMTEFTVKNSSNYVYYVRYSSGLTSLDSTSPPLIFTWDKCLIQILVSFGPPRQYADLFKINVIGATKNGGLENIDFGTVAYDKADVCDTFNVYYRNWFIHNPYDEDFREILQNCYDLNKEKIDRFYDHIHNLRTTAYTRMDVVYGERNANSDSYEYPLTGDVETSTPSSGTKATEESKTDTTTVEKDDDPIKTVNQVENLRTFHQMFIECFKPCFTLFECTSW